MSDITLVFDKGNNSEENIQALDASPYHFIGSLVPTQHQDLLNIPSEQFHYLKDPFSQACECIAREGSLWAQAHDRHHPKPALLQDNARHPAASTKKLRALRDLRTHLPQPRTQ